MVSFPTTSVTVKITAVHSNVPAFIGDIAMLMVVFKSLSFLLVIVLKSIQDYLMTWNFTVIMMFSVGITEIRLTAVH